jgi:hypothetical protein
MVIRVLVAALVLLVLVGRGTARHPGYLSWPMFSRIAGCEFRCVCRHPDGSVTEFNPWPYLPNLETGMTELGLTSFLEFLRTVHHLDLVGTVTLRDEHGTRQLTVEGTRVAAR